MTTDIPTESGIETRYVDETVRVQDDLFTHVNGRWLADAPIPADRAMDGAMRMLRDLSEHNVHALIEEAAASDPEPGSEAQKVGDLYSSFMDSAKLDELGIGPLYADLHAVASAGDKAELTTLLGRLDREGSGGLFPAGVEPDAKKSDEYIVYMMQGGLHLPDESYYREDKYADIRTAYVAHVAAMSKLAGLAPLAGFDDDGAFADAVMSLETELAASHWDVVACRDMEKAYNKMTRAELAASAPGFDWNAWIDSMEVPAGSFDTVVAMQPSFFSAAAEVWRNRPLNEWKAWLLFTIVHTAAPTMSAEFVDENFDFYGHTLSGTETIRDRWKRGVSLVEGLIGEAVGKVYVERHFPPESKARIDELVGNLIAAYRQSIKGLTWMGEETKARALTKLEKFTPKVGYPDKWRDYSKLEILPDDLVGNVRRASVYEHERELGKVGKPIDRSEWFMTPQTVNAYFNPLMNEIVFPAAILQPPFFSADADDAVNYGGMGAIIGHEIGHGFDDQGAKFDGDGNMVDWWTAEDKEAFEALTKSLIDQYDALVPKGLEPTDHVNGALTIGENIGDLGGLGIAHQAYRIALNGAEPPTMDGLSADQRFFMAWAAAWRSKARVEERKRRLATDPHSPEEFRCNQIVKNLDAFYAAFDVSPDDGMYLEPVARVAIW
ncbi:M13 family metallopeptidase [Spelaeicoccus albus]|uniref:Putative metalloendopeptidase n=1 Tax=Spelaeicoccus albus TaxID=1280376 RepID=A0A7Z0D0I3_9MICO|nr:M13-type metalloendopeptidase [Spelaeicoccus albus]NYI67389.1 putative metalloendopeptidase [Spelaeicoccus albus]